MAEVAEEKEHSNKETSFLFVFAIITLLAVASVFFNHILFTS